jgi:hypothetical protein
MESRRFLPLWNTTRSASMKWRRYRLVQRISRVRQWLILRRRVRQWLILRRETNTTSKLSPTLSYAFILSKPIVPCFIIAEISESRRWWWNEPRHTAAALSSLTDYSRKKETRHVTFAFVIFLLIFLHWRNKRNTLLLAYRLPPKQALALTRTRTRTRTYGDRLITYKWSR